MLSLSAMAVNISQELPNISAVCACYLRLRGAVFVCVCGSWGRDGCKEGGIFGNLFFRGGEIGGGSWGRIFSKRGVFLFFLFIHLFIYFFGLFGFICILLRLVFLLRREGSLIFSFIRSVTRISSRLLFISFLKWTLLTPHFPHPFSYLSFKNEIIF